MARRRGPTDRGRRDRIAKAAVAVVAERGLEGLTHRAVAKAAAVPLGSTTYHFSDREEMLEAAMSEAAAETRRKIEAWAAAIGEGEDLVEALADLLVRETSDGREMNVVAYELYLAALKRPALRPAAARWSANLRLAIERFADSLTAASLAAAAEGILVISLASGGPVDRQHATEILRRVAR